MSHPLLSCFSLVLCLWAASSTAWGQSHVYDDDTVYTMWEEDVGFGASLFIQNGASARILNITPPFETFAAAELIGAASGSVISVSGIAGIADGFAIKRATEAEAGWREWPDKIGNIEIIFATEINIATTTINYATANIFHVTKFYAGDSYIRNVTVTENTYLGGDTYIRNVTLTENTYIDDSNTYNTYETKKFTEILQKIFLNLDDDHLRWNAAAGVDDTTVAHSFNPIAVGDPQIILSIDPEGTGQDVQWLLEDDGTTSNPVFQAPNHIVLESNADGYLGGDVVFRDNGRTVYYGNYAGHVWSASGDLELVIIKDFADVYGQWDFRDYIYINPTVAHAPFEIGPNAWDVYVDNLYVERARYADSADAVITEVSRSIIAEATAAINIPTPTPFAVAGTGVASATNDDATYYVYVPEPTPQPTLNLQPGSSGRIEITSVAGGYVIEATNIAGQIYREQIGGATTEWVIDHDLAMFDPIVYGYNSSNINVSMQFEYLDENSLLVSSSTILPTSAVTIVCAVPGGGSGGISSFPTLSITVDERLYATPVGPNAAHIGMNTPTPSNTPTVTPTPTATNTFTSTPTATRIAAIADAGVQEATSQSFYHYVGDEILAEVYNDDLYRVEAQIDFYSIEALRLVTNAPVTEDSLNVLAVQADKSMTFGTVSDTTYDLEHDLLNRPLVQVHQSDSPRTLVHTEIRYVDSGEVQILTSAPPGEMKANFLRSNGSQLIGNGAATSIQVTHNANKNVIAQVWSNVSPYVLMPAEIIYSSSTQLICNFTVAPATEDFIVVWAEAVPMDLTAIEQFVMLGGENRNDMTGVHGNPDIIFRAMEIFANVVDVGYGLTADFVGSKQRISLNTPTPTPTFTATPTNTPTPTATPTSTNTPTATPTGTPIFIHRSGDVADSGEEWQWPEGVHSGIKVIESQRLRFRAPYTDADAEDLNDSLDADGVQDYEWFLWLPNGSYDEFSAAFRVGAKVRYTSLVKREERIAGRKYYPGPIRAGLDQWFIKMHQYGG